MSSRVRERSSRTLLPSLRRSSVRSVTPSAQPIYDAIMKTVIGTEDKQVQVMTERTEVREIVGDRVMQELIIK